MTTLRHKVVEPFLALIRLAVKRRLENPYQFARVGYDDLRRAIGPMSTGAMERLAHYFHNYWVGGSRVKKMTKRRDVDGVELMNQAFSIDRPILRLNPLQNRFDRGEQVPWMNFFAGASARRG